MRCAANLQSQIRRCIDQKPSGRTLSAANGDAGLCLRGYRARPGCDAVLTGTVPLWEPAASGAPKNPDANDLPSVDQTAPA
jgi:hypothetical protein